MIKLLIFFILSSITYLYSQDLPPVKIEFASQVVTSDNHLIGFIGNRNRIDLRSTGNVSKYVIYCLLATEDRDFYNHNGVSYKGIVRGILKTLTGQTQGGSTLTMQLAKNLFLSSERTISRKLTEIDLATKLEQKYTKDQILLMYLNTVYFGRGVYGIAAAAHAYFSKPADKLNVTESAALVGLLKNPNGYNPEHHADKMLNRRNEVLYNLVETGKLKNSEFQKFKKSPLGLKLSDGIGKYYVEQARKEAYNILKPFGKSLNTDELTIETACDFTVQRAADNAVETQWKNFPGGMKNAEIGLFTVENGTGYVRAIVGGNPTTDARGLNRSMQIKRQPGSSFKIFLYGDLISKGYSLATPLKDSVVIVDSGTVSEWKPSNADNSSTGRYLPMITAIQHSINLCAVDAINRLSAPDSVIAFAQKLGITSELPNYPSLSLGSGEVSPNEMAQAASVFASSGIYAKPITITKIYDKNGRIYYQNYPQSITVLDSATCYITTAGLQTVVDSGTASVIRKFYKGFAAGKTGTTSDYTDAWFVGYNKSLTTAIWVGFDNPQYKLFGGYQYGGTACAPIWGRMMGEISSKIRGFNTAPEVIPGEVSHIALCLESGEAAVEQCMNTKILPVKNTFLTIPCHLHKPEVDSLKIE